MNGTITINGGTVNASSYYGAGIGTALYGKMTGSINITDGTVNAVSKTGAGIGSGENGDCSGTISVTGGSVHAVSNDGGAGIGAGDTAKCDGGTISITGGTVEAEALHDASVWSTLIPPHAIGAGKNYSERGTINIADGLMVRSGDDKSSADWRYRENRVDKTNDQYALISPCTRHIEEPQDGYPVWSDYEAVDETNHTQHCVACNAAKELLHHDFGEPEWTWSDRYTKATTKFTCPTCTFETTLNATVTQEATQDGMVKSTATVECLGEVYTVEQDTGYQVLHYVRRSWNEETKQVEETTETLLDYILLEDYNDTDNRYFTNAEWLVVNGNVTFNNSLVITGTDSHLILCDGAKLTCNAGIICDVGGGGEVHQLTIYCQEGGTGELECTGLANSAGIGGGSNGNSCGIINIHGGNITATGGGDGAGIGGGDEGSGGTITIYGGIIKARSEDDGAGIGGGDAGNGGTITIYGGKVTAIAEEGGAGIGGGADGNNGIVNIYDGEINASCLGDDYGDGGNGGTVNIYGGIITAYAENDSEGAAIGGGKGGSHGTLTIADGWMVRSGDSASSNDWCWKENRVSDCQTHRYAKIYPCDVHENETYGEREVWDKTFKPDNDATHSYTCKACNGDANIQNHDIAVSWKWTPDCSEATAHFSCATCGFSKDVTASGDQVTEQIIDPQTDEHEFTATVTFEGNDYSDTVSGYPVNYTDLNGETQTAYVIDFITSDTTTISNGWYAVTSNVTIEDLIDVNGNVDLILCDDAELNAKSGVHVIIGNKLTIWGQSKNAGVLNATANSNAGIGAEPFLGIVHSGIITINGGTINATGANRCAGIGGGELGTGDVRINGGNVTATGGNSGAGIGGGYDGKGLVTINGGVVNAAGSNLGSGIGNGLVDPAVVTINGGIVTATGGTEAAGIGGGRYSPATVTINGGNVTATGGNSGAGIGGGNLGNGTVNINGGIVTAQGGIRAAGIGSGESDGEFNRNIGTVTITGGTINATSGWAAAIGGGNFGKGEVTITGGDITANSGGIGSGWDNSAKGTVTISYEENWMSVYSYEYHNTDITLSKVFTNGIDVYQPGAVTENAIKQKTLTPYDYCTGIHLAGHSISLDGDIAVNFYLNLSQDVINSTNDPYMLFNVPNTSTEYQTQKVYLSEAEEKDGYYLFKCRIAAKDMESKISAQLIDGDNKSLVYRYSVKEYADYLINHADEQHPEYLAVKPLVEAMLTYGAYANNYFSNADALEALEADIPAREATVSELPEGVSFEGAPLSLKSQTTLSLYFVSTQDVTLSMWGKTEGADYKLDHNGNEYVIRICNISAAGLNDNFTVTVTSGEERGTVTYSPMTYCYKAQTSDNAKLVNTVRALYLYWEATDEYFD